MRRIALCGRSGAGKSTFSTMLTEQLRGAGMSCVQIKLAAPLYELQALVYTVAGRPLVNAAVQDGLLLSDLGGHLRRINPAALTDVFTQRVQQAARDHPDAALICDDMRAADVDALTGLGFDIVEIHAPDAIRRERRRGRQDLTLVPETHPSETPLTAVAGHRVSNTGTLVELRAAAAQLATGLAVELGQKPARTPEWALR